MKAKKETIQIEYKTNAKAITTELKALESVVLRLKKLGVTIKCQALLSV